MSIEVNSNIIGVSENILEFVNNFLNKNDMSYFEHARVYNDGRSFRVTNSPIITEHFLQKKFALPDPSIYRKSGVFVWSSIDGLEKFDSQNLYLRVKFNIDHGVCFANVQDGYLEMFDFAATCGHISNVNYCVNNAGSIELFCKEYLERFNKIFQNIDKYLINIPLRPKDFSSKLPQSFDAITFRELECMALLANGYTAKMSAKVLGISHRTIERHIENIKDKLDINHKAELISTFLEYRRLLQSNPHAYSDNQN